MRELFCPSSVVVIGVSERRENLGKEIAGNFLEFGFTGILHFMGLEGGCIFGRKIHLSLDEIDEPIDLAVILTPAKTVPGLVEECGKKGIRRVVIESGGFGEYGESGLKLGEELVNIAKQYDIRFIGPNCIGIINFVNGLSTPFTTLKDVFRRGGVGIIAQSGGVALSLLNMFDNEQLGFSKFAAIGNKLNIDENDVLEYYLEDPDTSVICLYLESIRDGRRLTQIARRSEKPIVVHKSNIGTKSHVIAQSHTQALANDDMVVEAALSQAGVVRFRDMAGYLDFVKILQLPSMNGRNLAIVSRSGGHAVIAADAAHLYGFDLPPFSRDFLEEVRRHLRADVIRLANPLDLGDLFDFEVYVRIIEHTLQQDTVDGILFLHTYFAAIEGESSRHLLKAVAELAGRYDKPVALCVATESFEMSRLHKEFDFPIFMAPERAVQALDRSIQYHRRRAFLRDHPDGDQPLPAAQAESIRDILQESTGRKRPPLLHECLEVIRLAGLNVPDYSVVQADYEIIQRTEGIREPHAIKVVADGISHKSDTGGVVLGLNDRDAVRHGCREMFKRLSELEVSGVHGILVQKMVPRVPGSLEFIVGGKRDPYFGPMVLLGHGGVFVEILAKTSLRMAPVLPDEVEEMIEELPGSEIFRGVRGRPPIDREALKKSVLNIANLMVKFPEIDQIDVNPVIVSSRGAYAVDARIFLRNPGDAV